MPNNNNRKRRLQKKLLKEGKLPSSFENAIKICLCMIVKNESKIIERCLNAAKPILSYVSIVDTGSTDNTKEIIERWCKSNSLPFKIHEEPFKNFSYNRSHSYKLAKESFPNSSYFLLLDADMVLVVKPSFKKSQLVAPAYMIEQYSLSVRYWNLRLLGNLHVDNWECIGVTHEYWSSTPKTKSLKLNTLEIDDREDGGCKSDKYVRDKRLLLDGYNDPETPSTLKTRYSYYLGQTYECLKEYEEALKWFTIRSDEKNSWEEEAWYAQYKKAKCYLCLKEEEKFVLECLQAHNRRPWRAESLYMLICYFRSKHPTPNKGSAMNEVALMFALQAKEIDYPKEDVLFVEYDVYDYLIDVEIAITAYYVRGKKKLGKQASDRLKEKIKKGEIKQHHQNHIQSVVKFYD